MHYAYLDESGTVAPFQAKDCCLVIAVVAGNLETIQKITRLVRKLRRSIRRPPGAELKAADATPKQRNKLLTKLCQEDIAIIAVVLDKRTAYKAPADTEDWYREMVGRAAWHCATTWPELQLVLDKRYTKPALREKLETAIQAATQGTSCHLTIAQRESYSEPVLQAVDYIAWAIAGKYMADDPAYYELIREKIVIEERIEAC